MSGPAVPTPIPGHRDRESLLSACNSADGELHAIASSFDFLLCVSPTNTRDAMMEFLSAKGKAAPRLEYRELDFDPVELQKRIDEVELAHLHEPLVEGLLIEKRRELHLQLDLICARGTDEFRSLSERLYGGVSDDLLAHAQALLGFARPHRPRARVVDAEELARRSKQLIALYAREDPAFRPVVEIRDDVGGLMVSYPKLMIPAGARVSERRVDPLLSHEVSVHLLTGHNGASQGLSLFATGLAGYEEIQEGLGVFAEWAVGGLDFPRIRLIAGRVVAVHAMLAGADFVECFRLLHEHHDIRPQRAFTITARAYRSGGLAKDAIYLRGFYRVMEWIADGGSLDPFWRAKIAPLHIPILDQLAEQGLVHEAVLTPEFLDRPEAQKRIADYRANPRPDLLIEAE